MRIPRRLTLRKMKEHRSGFIGIGALILVGVAFFITLFTINFRYEETAEAFFREQHYSDATLTGNFEESDLQKLVPHTTKVLGRTTEDIRKGDVIYRKISLTEGINNLFLYEGRLPHNEDECVILKRNADVLGIGIGDSLNLKGQSFKITGLAASPEYVYLVEDDAMVPEDRFIVLYTEVAQAPYDELVTLTEGTPDKKELLTVAGGESVTLLKDQPNYMMYQEDLDQIGTFAYIFPAVFAILIAVVIYIMLARTMTKERKILGIKKALGLADWRIMSIYIAGYGLLAIPAALLGCMVAMLLCDTIIGIMGSMFVVPTLGFAFYPFLWLGAIAVSCLICVLSGWLGMVGILKLSPAQSMRPREPKNGKKILLEHWTGLWKRLSWGTRYAIKSSLRNKGRFFAVVLGMAASCALITFSLGFYNSIKNTQTKFFNEVANYEAIVKFAPLPLTIDYQATDFSDDYAKALVLPVEVETLETRMTVVSEDFDKLRIPQEDLDTGVVIPKYMAGELNLEVGDTITVKSTEADEKDYDLKISGIIEQNLGLSLYTTWDYLKSVDSSFPEVYNVLFMSSDQEGSLIDNLQKENLNFTSIAEDETSLGSIMESLTVLIGFMVACAIILGVAVLYSVGQINLAARSYEYMFMGVMGYSRKNIIWAHIKETLLQLIIGIPIGFLLGNLLLEFVKGAFSGMSFVVATAINASSYLIAAGVTILITALMVPVTARYIGKMDLVEGLKAQDD